MFRPFRALLNPEAPATGATPPAHTAPVVPNPAPPAPHAHPGPTEAELKAKVLAELGIANLDEAKAAIEAQRKKAEADKSDAERAAAAKAEAEAIKAQLAAAQATLQAQATAALEGLTAEQKDAVTKLAGSDPAKTLEAVSAIRKLMAPPPAGANTQAPPAQTAPPAGGAPPPAAPSPNQDKKAVHAELQKKNPFLAANFLFRHNGVLG